MLELADQKVGNKILGISGSQKPGNRLKLDTKKPTRIETNVRLIATQFSEIKPKYSTYELEEYMKLK